MAKKEMVQEMFDGIAPKYDLLNHLLSLGIDKLWRKKAMRIIGNGRASKILDVACGTGDFSMEALKHGVQRVIGVDISENMLNVAREKMQARGLSDRLEFVNGDCEHLPFKNDEFDAVTVAFGVRNFEHLEKGLAEMFRVVKPGGHVVILEFSRPARFPIKQLYNFYFRYLLPRIGGMISGDRQAYAYLPASVFAFPEGEKFLNILSSIGFERVSQQRLTGGIATLYVGIKDVSHGKKN